MSLPLLGEVVALFAVSVLIAYICYRIRLVPIAGFLIAGVFIGPGALSLVQDTALIYNLAEIGVILLLFTIGVEFSLEKLARIKRFIVMGGTIQATLMVALVVFVLALFEVDWRLGVFTGFLVVLSSTAIVLKLLSERGQMETPAGQVSLALLIFQDLAMVMMVLFVPALSGEQGTMADIVLVLLKAAVIIAFVLLAARRAIPWLLEKIAQTRREELFLLAVVAICLGTAWFTSLLGISLALGAFLAGLVVSESKFSGYALAEILPLRTVFNAIFFVSIGMLLDLGFLLTHPVMVLGVAASVLVLKVVITGATVMMLGYPVRVAAFSAFALAQICESSFVLERAGAAVGLTPAGMGATGQQAFIAVAVLLMVITPLLTTAGPYVGEWLSRSPLGRGGRNDPDGTSTVKGLENHVIVVGYGPAGRRLVETLQAAGIPFVVIELNPDTVEELEAEGLPALYGDAGRIRTLEEAGIRRAKACALVMNDMGAVERVVELAHFLNPIVQIIARVRFIVDAERVRRLGADIVVPEELEASLRVLSHVLNAYMMSPREAARWTGAAREPGRGIAGGESGRESAEHEPRRESAVGESVEPVDALDEAASGLEAAADQWDEAVENPLATRIVSIRPNALAAGKSLGELALKELFDIGVITVRRDGSSFARPSPEFTLQAGDRLVLTGDVQQFEACGHLFRRTAD